MKKKATLILSIITLLLAAFTGPISIAQAAVSTDLAASTNSGTSTTVGPSSTTTSYSPQPGDVYLQRDGVSLDLKNSYLLQGKGYPEPVSLVLKGTLPDPCHQLRVIVYPPDANKRIKVQAYSVFNPKQGCITLIQPFTATISLGSFVNGTYSIYVNGLLFRSFSIATPVLAN